MNNSQNKQEYSKQSALKLLLRIATYIAMLKIMFKAVICETHSIRKALY